MTQSTTLDTSSSSAVDTTAGTNMTTGTVDPDTGLPTTTSLDGSSSTTGPDDTTSSSSSGGESSTGLASTTDPGTSSGGGPTCDEVFGTALNYVLCETDGVSCTFNVEVDGDNCDNLCAMFGVACIDQFDNPGAGMECFVQEEVDCNINLGEFSTICVCALP